MELQRNSDALGERVEIALVLNLLRMTVCVDDCMVELQQLRLICGSGNLSPAKGNIRDEMKSLL
jgi:hypothetical protein